MPRNFLSNGALRDVLALAREEELLSLTKIVDPSATRALSAIELQQEISKAGGHAVMNALRNGQGTGYIDMLDDIVGKLDIKGMPGYLNGTAFHGRPLRDHDEISRINQQKLNIDDAKRHGLEYAELAETKITAKLLQTRYESLSTEERAAWDAKVQELSARFSSNPARGLAGSAALIALLNMGGFATYTLMSSALSFVTIGALPFVGYTVASSLLSFLIGPAGWAALAAILGYKLGAASFEKTIPIVLNVGAIRQRLNSLGTRIPCG